MLPPRATILSRGLASGAIALLLTTVACVAQETTPGPLHEVPPKERPILQEIAFDAQCEGPIAEREQFPAMRVPTYHPGGVSNPKLPEAARKAGHDGMAVVSVLVNEKGRVTIARLHRSTGYPELDKLALEHTSKWKLAPGKVDDKPVCTWALFPIRFERHQARTHR